MLVLVFIVLLFAMVVLTVPIGHALGITSFIAIIYGSGAGSFSPELVANRLFYGINSFTLIAVPLFILAGQIMNAAKLTDRIFTFINKAIGHITGGLGHVNVVASMLFAGMSGSATADAGGLGAVEIKAMKDAGYPDDFSVGITGASSMIGTIIPPSIPLIVYGILANASIGHLFLGGLVPGILMGVGLMILSTWYALRGKYPRTPRAKMAEILSSFRTAFLALLTPVIIIGGIWSGYFTPTEAGATAVAYSVFLGLFVYRNVSLKELWDVFMESAKLSVRVLFILVFGAFYGYLLIRFRIPMIMADYLLTLTASPFLLLIIINVFLLLIGCFMSTLVSVTILTPILMPIVTAFGINPIHFGVIMVFNLTLGNLTPPFGLVLYTLSSVANMPVIKVVKAVLPFLVPLLIVLLICITFPQIVTFIPLKLM
jgi:tripartite ATP-independent transporter DctM subunit